MEPTQIDEALSRHALIGLDSCILIYALEAHPVFGRVSQRIMDRVKSGDCQAALSTIAMMEVLCGPYKRGDEDAADGFFILLTQFRNVRWLPLGFAIADRAAMLKAEYRLSTADAVHIATALESGATLFVTNDRGIPWMPEIQLLVI